jgi:hypothetical protein
MDGKVVSIFKAKEEAVEEVKLDEVQDSGLVAAAMERNFRLEQKKILARKDRNQQTLRKYNIERRDQ